MGLGFLLGVLAVASTLSVLILPLTFLMMYPMVVNLKLKQL